MRLSLLGAWLSSAAVGQQNPPPQTSFAEVVDVRVVNVEVVVTDRDGQVVTGLHADDFSLLVDGEPTPIAFFNEVESGRVSGAAAENPGPVGAVGDEVPTNFLVFFDDYFSIGPDRDRMLGLLEQHLEDRRSRDQVAIVRYDGLELERMTNWTAQASELDEALRQLRRRKARGIQRAMQVRPDRINVGQQDRIFDGGGFSNQLSLNERYYVNTLMEQIERSTTAVASTLRSFGTPSGRRVLLLFCGGWPFRPLEFVIDEPGRLLSEHGRYDSGRELFSRISDTANLLGYTIYPVDVPGLEATSFVDSASDGFSNNGTVLRPSYEQEATKHQTLHFLAESTGGKPFINAARNGALSSIAEDLDSFYWLGFTPERQGDDTSHEIRVTVNDPSLEVRHRSDFFDFSREREATLVVESALYFGDPPSPFPLDVRLGRPEKAGRRKVELPLAIGIPADGLTWLPGPGGVSAQAELRIAVLDKNGQTVDTPVIPLAMTLEDRPAPGTILGYQTRLLLRKVRHDLVVALLDVASGTFLSSKVEVDL